jgi:hypothetical protein
MVDRTFGEAAAHRKSGMTGADDNGRYVAQANQLLDRANAPISSL